MTSKYDAYRRTLLTEAERIKAAEPGGYELSREEVDQVEYALAYAAAYQHWLHPRQEALLKIDPSDCAAIYAWMIETLEDDLKTFDRHANPGSIVMFAADHCDAPPSDRVQAMRQARAHYLAIGAMSSCLAHDDDLFDALYTPIITDGLDCHWPDAVALRRIMRYPDERPQDVLWDTLLHLHHELLGQVHTVSREAYDACLAKMKQPLQR